MEYLRVTFGVARAFGLSDEEIWQTVTEVCERVPDEITPESVEELTDALASRIQAKSRLS
jgi:hypothetical protein